jgi:hypothetical protein
MDLAKNARRVTAPATRHAPELPVNHAIVARWLPAAAARLTFVTPLSNTRHAASIDP